MTTLLEFGFLPAVAVGFFLARRAFRMSPGPGRSASAVGGFALITIPHFVLFAYWTRSIDLVLLQEFVMAAWPAGIGWFSWRRAVAVARAEGISAMFRRRIGRSGRKAAPAGAVTLLMTVLAVVMGWFFLGDVLLPRRVVTGTVDGYVTTRAGVRGISTPSIVIDGRDYEITRDIVRQIGVGGEVRAEISAASRTVLKISCEPGKSPGCVDGR